MVEEMETSGQRICWNTKCGATISKIWKQGWKLRSGRLSSLCETCGLVFEQSRFCELFHADDAGWRTCNSCQKLVHCGCISSASTFILLDKGGVECVSCSIRDAPTKLNQLFNISSESTSLQNSLKSSDQSSDEEQEEDISNTKKRKHTEADDALEDSQVPSNITSNLVSNSKERAADEAQKKKVITEKEIQQVTNGKYPILLTDIQTTDSTIVPLFEKVLTLSDTGRIGRLVLPKACAEAFFPPISVPEGIPITIWDVKGREWQFQFRFWPNNSSRMYVLEGVIVYVKEMQLQAGDVVTFSRIDPGGKMLLGYRKDTSKVVKDDARKDKKASAAPSVSVSVSVEKMDCSNTTKQIESKRSAWEEAQDLLTPPPGITPSIMTIEGHKFEEYEEPPILATRSIASHQVR